MTSSSFELLRKALPKNHAWVTSKGKLHELHTLQNRYKAGVAYLVVTDTELLQAEMRSGKNCFTPSSMSEKIRQADVLECFSGL